MTKEQMLATITAIKNGDLEYITKLLIDDTDLLNTYLVHDSGAMGLMIHYASMLGQLSIVRLLLEKKPDLLNAVEHFNLTPLFFAAAYGHYQIVDYLLSKDADFNIATFRPGHKDHGQTALMRAMEAMYYEAANLIILKINADKSKDFIPAFVMSGRQAISLMLLDPALISIFMHDERICDLLKKAGCNFSEETIGYYKISGRRPSFFAQINTSRGTSVLYNPVKRLGSGSYGTVRLFQTDEGQEVSVKSFEDEIVDIDTRKERSASRLERIKREAGFNRRAYPDEKLSEVFGIFFKGSAREKYTNRYVMPYVKGETARSFIKVTRCARQLAEIILQIALEIQRIHTIGIIHGDLNFRNIMIYSPESGGFIIRLIDFGFSYDKSDATAKLFMSDRDKLYHPPELFNDKKEYVIPDPNQDVYSFGFILNYVFNEHESNEELMRLFPSIKVFILAAQNICPSARPTLDSLCRQLSFELRHPTDEHSSLAAMEVLPGLSVPH